MGKILIILSCILFLSLSFIVACLKLKINDANEMLTFFEDISDLIINGKYDTSMLLEDFEKPSSIINISEDIADFEFILEEFKMIFEDDFDVATQNELQSIYNLHAYADEIWKYAYLYPNNYVIFFDFFIKDDKVFNFLVKGEKK